MRSRRLLGATLAASAALALALSAGAAADNDTGAALHVGVRAGSITLTATSTASAVQFTEDGVVHDPMPVVDGTAELTLVTWGERNGNHSASARDCTATACTGRGMAAQFTVANAAPAITSPAAGGSVLGGFTVLARSPGAALQVLIDGRRAGYADGPHFRFSHTHSALAPGKHTVRVLECTSDHSLCAGPASPTVRFVSQALRPAVSVAPSVVSPNGDGVDDRTSVRFRLSRAESVVLSAVDSHGRTVTRHAARRYGKGLHHWQWLGHGFDGRRVPNGRYTLRVATSAVVHGAMVRGTGQQTVRVDDHPPSMRSVTGGGAMVYPHRDGFRDTFTPHLTLSEPAHLRIVVRNAHHHVVGTGTARGTRGRTSVTWDGRNIHGRVAVPGHDTWTVTATDAAGNRSRTAPRTVIVSKRHLAKRSVTITRDGDAYTHPQVSAACATTSRSDSVYRPGGVLLRTTCSPSDIGPQVAAVDYGFTLPRAVKYGPIGVRVVGSSTDNPSQIEASFPRSDTDDVTVSAPATADSSARRSYALGSVAGSTHVSGRRVDLVLSVDDLHVDSNTARASSFDVDSVRLTATYYVLR